MMTSSPVSGSRATEPSTPTVMLTSWKRHSRVREKAPPTNASLLWVCVRARSSWCCRCCFCRARSTAFLSRPRLRNMNLLRSASSWVSFAVSSAKPSSGPRCTVPSTSVSPMRYTVKLVACDVNGIEMSARIVDALHTTSAPVASSITSVDRRALDSSSGVYGVGAGQLSTCPVRSVPGLSTWSLGTPSPSSSPSPLSLRRHGPTQVTLPFEWLLPPPRVHAFAFRSTKDVQLTVLTQYTTSSSSSLLSLSTSHDIATSDAVVLTAAVVAATFFFCFFFSLCFSFLARLLSILCCSVKGVL
eukprot:PhM_4_TR12641/c0_g1_i1/m.100167